MKNILYKQFVLALLSVLVFTSCNKYLDVTPKGKSLLKTTTNYDQWLNNSALYVSLPSELNLLADNKDNINLTDLITSSNDRIYTWEPQFSETVRGTAYIWRNFYASIYKYNVVIKGVDAATGGTQQQIKSLKAEALLGRAFEYMYLVNLYGKVYNSTTADQDLAVPFVTSIDVTDPIPGRSTVQQIYDHIITDITTAIPDLPVTNSTNRFRGSKAAGYAILARTYLYMGDYTKASKNAQLALDNFESPTVLDWSGLTDATAIPILNIRSDAIYARLAGASYMGMDVPTIAFLKSFNKKDLRLNFYYTKLGNYTFPTRGKVNIKSSGVSGGYAYLSWGPSVAEMRLIIAEAAARANDLPTALEQLHLVRKCRFKAVDYVRYQSTVQSDVLNKILDERTWEFAFVGMRWFDMRRLDNEGRMPQVVRYNGAGAVAATLAPHSDRYTLQIPDQVMYYNPDWKQNP